MSVKHFIHQAFDVFTHFESKVLRTAWLIIRKPGFVTQENLRGVRVPYAKPVQLFIIVNLAFYLLVSYLHRSDYVPAAYDNNSSFISERPFLKWTEPLDLGIKRNIDSLRSHKLEHYRSYGAKGTSYYVFRSFFDKDSLQHKADPPSVIEQRRQLAFFNTYDQKIAVYSKTLIFLLVPVFALLLYLCFYKRLQYFGSALILSTHFVVFNLLLYMMLVALSDLPYQWFGVKELRGLPFRLAGLVMYNPYTSGFFTAVLGLYQGWEALHILFLGGWLFIAFKRLFQLPWWQNLLASYLLARIFYILVFCLFKKGVMAFTLWNM